MQIRPSDADRFLAKPDPAKRVILLFGSDEGLVSERATAFANKVIGEDDPSLGRIALDSASVAADPGLLADEAHAVAMFGGDRVITVRVEGNRPIQNAVQGILDQPPTDAWIVLTAGELRKGSGLRGLCEKHPAAAAIACYSDDIRALDRMIDEELAASDLTMDDDARAALKALIGSDRRISRSETRKLCLYALGKGSVTADDVRAIVGDAAAFAIDEAVDAMTLGRLDALERAYRRLIAAGTPGVVIAGAAQRHFNFLHSARAACDGGSSPDNVVARARPPVFYQRQPAVKRQLGMWSVPRIERGLEILDEAVLASRVHGAIGDSVISQAMSRIAVAAGGRD